MTKGFRHTCRLGLVLSAGLIMNAARPPASLGQIPPKPPEILTSWGDQGDGTYVNPVIPGDYSDIDAIRVGDTYYAISSTFQFSPGVIIITSKDMVNWTILGHAVPDITQIGPHMNWDVMDRYGRGVWAGSIRHHAGKFWIYFGTPDEGFFMTSAVDPAGPWEPLHPVMKSKGWDDCCPFWDDDGQGYFICTNFADGYKIHLFKMTPDGKGLIPESDKVVYSSKGSEANKLYKINGTYYHYFSEVRGGEGRVIMMGRAKSLDGPWERRQINHVRGSVDREPNQGGLLQAPSGDWWFFTHHGVGKIWDGRVASLLPVTWVDGWPIIGKPGHDGLGTMVWTARKPIQGHPPVFPQSDDDFDGKLGVQWEWNYQPRAEKFSLTERPGHLRLHAFKPLRKGDLLKAGNTITQRAMRGDASEVTVKLDLAGMVDGQQAGLCHFAGVWSSFGVVQEGDVRTLTYRERETTKPGPVIQSNDLWLRSTWGYDGKSTYAYSTDGTTFTPFGDEWQLTWGNYRGDRIGIYSFNDKSEAGYLDVDQFRYSYTKPPAASKR